MIQLPTKVAPATGVNPKKIFLFAHTKVGKTLAASLLPNNLIIDLESSTHFYDCLSVDVKKEAAKTGKSVLVTLKEIANAIKNSEHKYDYITIDSASALEDLAASLATILYKKSSVGRNFDGKDVVSELSKGAGYQWLRKGFDELYSLFEDLPVKCLIILGHVKLSSIEKGEKEIQIKDVNLTGKIKLGVAADVDAIGLLYRDPEDNNKTIIDFTTEEGNLFSGARPGHLKNKKLTLVELKDGKFINYWDQIFI